jgi:hypothetical protein
LMQVSGGTSLKHCWRDATKAALTVLVILISMGLQFVLTGWKAFMGG